MEVELLAGGDTVAAVEGPLMAEEPVITDSDRVIGGRRPGAPDDGASGQRKLIPIQKSEMKGRRN